MFCGTSRTMRCQGCRSLSSPSVQRILTHVPINVREPAKEKERNAHTTLRRMRQAGAQMPRCLVSSFANCSLWDARRAWCPLTISTRSGPCSGVGGLMACPGVGPAQACVSRAA